MGAADALDGASFAEDELASGILGGNFRRLAGAVWN